MNIKSPKSSIAPKNRGFTLIEVLVVSILVSIFFIGLPKASSNFFHQKSYLLTKYRANTIAWNQLMEQYMVNQKINTKRSAKKDGKQEQWGQQWRWKKDEERTLIGRIRKYSVQVFEEKNTKTPVVNLILFLNVS